MSAVLAYDYFDVDMVEVAHGRAPAVATGMKRTNPDKIIFSYQGDGDLAAIGTAEIIHAAHRGEQITVIFINNAVFGMTGGAIYIERCSLHDPAQIRKTKKAVRHAFELQVNHAEGLSMVEILSPCPTNWKMTPIKSMEWIEKELTRTFPLGCLKDVK